MPLHSIKPAARGVNALSAPDAVDYDEAPLVENLLADRDGSLPIRGPWTHKWALTSQGLSSIPIGVAASGTSALVTYAPRTSTGFLYRSDRFAHLSNVTGQELRTTMDVHLGIAGPTTATAANSTGQSLPWRRSAAYGEWAYAFAAQGAASHTVPGANGAYYPGKLLRWKPVSVIEQVTGPLGGADLAVYMERLWSAGGVAPGAAPEDAYEPNTLYFSEPGDPVDWTDAVSGLVNRVVVDNSVTDNLTGLAPIDGALLVFKRNAVYRLTGAGPASFAIKRVTSGMGCIDAMSILPFDDGAFFMSAEGLIWHNGYEARDVSRQIRPLLRPALRTVLSDGGRITSARLGNEHVMVSLVTREGVSLFAALYNVPRGTWTLLSSSAMRQGVNGGGNPDLLFSTTQGAFALARTPESPNYRVWSAERLLEGLGDWASLTSTHGYDAGPTSFSPIPAKWWTRLVALGSPTQAAAIRRLFVDYNLQPRGGDARWRVKLLTGNGVELAQWTLAAVEEGRRQARFQTSVHTEAVDVQLRIELVGARADTVATANVLGAELYTASLEYATTHQRPTV